MSKIGLQLVSCHNSDIINGWLSVCVTMQVFSDRPALQINCDTALVTMPPGSNLVLWFFSPQYVNGASLRGGSVCRAAPVRARDKVCEPEFPKATLSSRCPADTVNSCACGVWRRPAMCSGRVQCPSGIWRVSVVGLFSGLPLTSAPPASGPREAARSTQRFPQCTCVRDAPRQCACTSHSLGGHVSDSYR